MLSLGKKILICDTTLRDGEQMPGVVFSYSEKIDLAKKSAKFGSNILELMPSISKSEQKLAKELSAMNLGITLTASTPSRKKHVETAIDCNMTHITLFSSVSDIHLEHKLGISREVNTANSLEIIDFAKEQGLSVAFAGEDSSRADIDYLSEFIREMEGKIDYFLPCDTVGCLTPFTTYELIRRIKEETNMQLALHIHNDFGMATANTLAGIKAGAEIFSGTFNGIGERCGNAALEEVCTALKFLEGKSIDAKLWQLTGICSAVEKYSGVPMHRHKPITGRNAFCHESGIHVDGVIKHAENYEYLNPSDVGQEREFSYGKHSGKNALKQILPPQVTESEIASALEKIKSLSETRKKSLTKEETECILA